MEDSFQFVWNSIIVVIGVFIIRDAIIVVLSKVIILEVARIRFGALRRPQEENESKEKGRLIFLTDTAQAPKVKN